MISRRLWGAVAVPVLAVLVLAGCSESPTIANNGNAAGYVSGSGAYKEIAPAARGKVVSFSSTSDSGAKVTSADFAGKVHVLNFWYAGCGPCIAEAPLLESVYTHYKGSVPFLGVNTYDQAATARAFETAYKVSYPSVIDVNNVAVQYAFSDSIPADAVPTTLVIDRKGRVAARVTGEVESASILRSLIDTVVAEGK